jgi:hypothetical protein
MSYGLTLRDKDASEYSVEEWSKARRMDGTKMKIWGRGEGEIDTKASNIE